MNFAKFEHIKIDDNRIRKDSTPEKNEELVKSIREIGLLNLPILKRLNEGFQLIAGYRRLSAIQYLNEIGVEILYIGQKVPLGFLPYVAFEELSAEQALEIELQENTIREDLSWQDRVSAIARLHALYKSRDTAWSQKETAESLGMTHLGDKLVLAENISDPDVAAAKTEKEALTIIKKKMEAEFRGSLLGSKPAEEIDLRVGDARELLQELEDGSVHCFLTDPPYGISAGSFGVGEKHTYEDSPVYFKNLLSEVIPVMFKKAAEQAHLFVFCDLRSFAWLHDLCDDFGWIAWNNPFIWHKDVGHVPDANLGPRNEYECILYANKGKRAVSKVVSDVIEIPADKNKRHPAQKPIDLLRFFLALSVMPGDVVCDPFCGSGSIFLATKGFRVTTIGMEKDKDTADTAQVRWLEES